MVAILLRDSLCINEQRKLIQLDEYELLLLHKNIEA